MFRDPYRSTSTSTLSPHSIGDLFYPGIDTSGNRARRDQNEGGAGNNIESLPPPIH